MWCIITSYQECDVIAHLQNTIHYDLLVVLAICCFICSTMPALGCSGMGGGGALGRTMGGGLFCITKTLDNKKLT